MSCLKRKSGFTLPEVMAGVFVTALCLISIYALTWQSKMAMRASRNESRAAQAAQYEMERLRTSWSGFAGLGSVSFIAPSNNYALADLPAGTGIVYKTAFTNFHTNSQIYNVTIAVSWKKPDGSRGTNVLVGMISEQGLVH